MAFRKSVVSWSPVMPVLAACDVPTAKAFNGRSAACDAPDTPFRYTKAAATLASAAAATIEIPSLLTDFLGLE
jgi:hypothetical protein